MPSIDKDKVEAPAVSNQRWKCEEVHFFNKAVLRLKARGMNRADTRPIKMVRIRLKWINRREVAAAVQPHGLAYDDCARPGSHADLEYIAGRLTADKSEHFYELADDHALVDERIRYTDSGGAICLCQNGTHRRFNRFGRVSLSSH